VLVMHCAPASWIGLVMANAVARLWSVARAGWRMSPRSRNCQSFVWANRSIDRAGLVGDRLASILSEAGLVPPTWGVVALLGYLHHSGHSLVSRCGLWTRLR
jgi:hypothetical protein